MYNGHQFKDEMDIMINQMIRKLRKDFNISQVDLASRLNVTKQCVSNWENDNILPSVEMLIKIAKIFNVSTDYILGLESKSSIDVTGLTDLEITHIKLLVEDLKNRKK